MNLPEFNNMEFYTHIENLVWNLDISYLDAIMHYIEKNDIEPESLVPLIKKNQVLMRNIYEEAQRLNMVEKITFFVPS